MLIAKSSHIIGDAIVTSDRVTLRLEERKEVTTSADSWPLRLHYNSIFPNVAVWSILAGADLICSVLMLCICSSPEYSSSLQELGAWIQASSDDLNEHRLRCRLISTPLYLC